MKIQITLYQISVGNPQEQRFGDPWKPSNTSAAQEGLSSKAIKISSVTNGFSRGETKSLSSM